MEIQLVCHGMMLFWYRPVVGSVQDGYRILIPQSPNKEHELRLGVGPGALPSALGYDAKPKGTQHFALEFGVGASQKPRGPKTKNSELLMYRIGGVSAVPDDRASADAGVAFIIDIPYPVREDAVRACDYEQDPYLDGSAVRTFDIHPRRMLDARVFTFALADDTKDVILRSTDGGTDQPLVKSKIPDGLRLHLYCQPLVVMQGMDHLHLLNAMLKLGGKTLDLDLNHNRNPKKDPTMPIPTGLSFKDLLHLSELPPLMSGASKGHPQREKVEPSFFAIDPAECGQGGGC